MSNDKIEIMMTSIAKQRLLENMENERVACDPSEHKDEYYFRMIADLRSADIAYRAVEVNKETYEWIMDELLFVYENECKSIADYIESRKERANQ